MEEVGPVSLDSKKSQQAKQEKLREEAQYEKERGNNFVKQEKWDEAIACYNRAIELVKDDAIYFANRGLCHLKKDSLHAAESDCTEALRLDPTYVKALQRRATARERLGSLRAASHDLAEVLKLEPHNLAAKKQLDAIKARMGTKGSKSKSSPVPSPLSTPTMESKPIPTSAKIIELPDEPAKPVLPKPDPVEMWRNGVGENITVIKPVKKPPHLRSKRPLKNIPIQEILLGKTSPEKPPTRLKITELDDLARGDSNNNNNNTESTKVDPRINEEKGKGDMNISSPESVKLITDVTDTEKEGKDTKGVKESKEEVKETKGLKDLSEGKETCKRSVQELVPPVNSVQFMTEWKNLKGNSEARGDYLSIIDPSKIPSIFANALESDILSEVIATLHDSRDKVKARTVAAYLQGLSAVKRFRALAMFLGDTDKKLLTDLLHHCKTVENLSEEELADLKNKYEI